jgi:hypothetical protein
MVVLAAAAEQGGLARSETPTVVTVVLAEAVELVRMDI